MAPTTRTTQTTRSGRHVRATSAASSTAKSWSSKISESSKRGPRSLFRRGGRGGRGKEVVRESIEEEEREEVLPTAMNKDVRIGIEAAGKNSRFGGEVVEQSPREEVESDGENSVFLVEGLEPSPSPDYADDTTAATIPSTHQPFDLQAEHRKWWLEHSAAVSAALSTANPITSFPELSKHDLATWLHCLPGTHPSNGPPIGRIWFPVPSEDLPARDRETSEESAYRPGWRRRQPRRIPAMNRGGGGGRGVRNAPAPPLTEEEAGHAVKRYRDALTVAEVMKLAEETDFLLSMLSSNMRLPERADRSVPYRKMVARKFAVQLYRLPEIYAHEDGDPTHENRTGNKRPREEPKQGPKTAPLRKRKPKPDTYTRWKTPVTSTTPSSTMPITQKRKAETQDPEDSNRVTRSKSRRIQDRDSASSYSLLTPSPSVAGPSSPPPPPPRSTFGTPLSELNAPSSPASPITTRPPRPSSTPSSLVTASPTIPEYPTKINEKIELARQWLERLKGSSAWLVVETGAEELWDVLVPAGWPMWGEEDIENPSVERRGVTLEDRY